jgi:hypothetical protein
MAEHSALPWSIPVSSQGWERWEDGLGGPIGNADTSHLLFVYSDDDTIDPEVARANREFVLRAVNAHDALVAACEMALRLTRSYPRPADDEGYRFSNQVTSALADALDKVAS